MEMLEWLNKMQQSVFSISRTLADAIGIRNVEEKKQLQSNFKMEANSVIEESIIFCDSYAEINNRLGIDLEKINTKTTEIEKLLKNILRLYLQKLVNYF